MIHGRSTHRARRTPRTGGSAGDRHPPPSRRGCCRSGDAAATPRGTRAIPRRRPRNQLARSRREGPLPHHHPGARRRRAANRAVRRSSKACSRISGGLPRTPEKYPSGTAPPSGRTDPPGRRRARPWQRARGIDDARSDFVRARSSSSPRPHPRVPLRPPRRSAPSRPSWRRRSAPARPLPARARAASGG